MNIKLIGFIYCAISIILLECNSAIAQENDKSLAFKKNRPQKKYTIFYQPDLSYQIQKQFNLIRDANAGIPLAQHELGLRYLLGEDGLKADTVKGAYWVGKAAEQSITAACYNYGILLINGWGVDWNPYKAFDYFMKAAKDGMAQAQYFFGMLHTDNLIVKKNYLEAYGWIKKAAEQNFQPAIDTKKELEKYLPPGFLRDSSNFAIHIQPDSTVNSETSFSSHVGLVFIDFDAVQDTIQKVEDKQLIEDLFHEFNMRLADSLNLKIGDSSFINIPPDKILELLTYAEYGNSEALTIIGRFYESGTFFEKNSIKASLNYLLASQLSYPKAKFLLLKMLSNDFINDLIYEIKTSKNPEAMFVFYGLWSLGLYNQIIKDEAIKYLNESANQEFLTSMIELGQSYYSGKGTDNKKSITIWERAALTGSVQAKLRLSATNIFDGTFYEPIEKSILNLKSAVEYGSVLAQIALAYAYENGIGVQKNKAEAVKYYRYAAQRGNLTGYTELKRLYDEIRPSEKRFMVN
ncbi:MAG: sel1 repeat family protein [Ignavibacteriaceae bacterium]|nr:sel1 repeat family protein [Ignavibacteriaceae bacterium]